MPNLVATRWGDVVGFSVEEDGEPDERGVLFENIPSGPQGWSTDEAWEWAQRICEALNAQEKS